MNTLVYNFIMSDSLYGEIIENTKNKVEKVDDFEEIYQTQTLLIFKINDTSYAIESKEVKEIIRNTEIFPVPFVPPYLKGVLNYYSKPFAIVDFSMLIGENQQDSKIFMVLNAEGSVALQVTDIQEFKGESDTVMHNFSNSENSNFFKGAIKTEDEMIPIFNMTNILERIKNDIEKQ